MTDPSENVELPALAGIDGPIGSYKVLRTLTADDRSSIAQARGLYGIVKPIMTMFHIVGWNYDVLQRFAKTLTVERSSAPHPMLGANRHIFNYVASAASLLDHFALTYKRGCRHASLPTTGFDDLRRKLERENDAFQFFAAFRNHVLHAGLPVGRLTEQKSLSEGYQCAITYSSADLLATGRGDWSSCRLLKKEPTVHLMSQIDSFHQILRGTILNAVIACVRTDLDAANAFHRRLADEVHAAYPGHRPCIMIERITVGNEFTWKFDVLPEDLLHDLGLIIKSATPPAQ